MLKSFFLGYDFWRNMSWVRSEILLTWEKLFFTKLVYRWERSLICLKFVIFSTKTLINYDPFVLLYSEIARFCLFCWFTNLIYFVLSKYYFIFFQAIKRFAWVSSTTKSRQYSLLFSLTLSISLRKIAFCLLRDFWWC